jgi:hypothetical protein
MTEDPKPMCLNEQGVGSFSNIIEGYPTCLKEQGVCGTERREVGDWLLHWRENPESEVC